MDTTKHITDVGVAIAGAVDSGKSSFIGVLTSGNLDNGRGLARNLVAKHPHEIKSGQTSDISIKILESKYNAVTFIDLCGHDKYLKTTAKGISGHFPDYGCIVISPQRGVMDMTQQHYKMLISHNIPIFFVITRIDVAMEKSYKLLIENLTKLCKRTGGQKIDLINTYDSYYEYKNQTITKEEFEIQKKNNIDKVINHMNLNNNGKQNIIPVITISNVNGYYTDVTKNIILNLKPRDLWSQNQINNRVIKAFNNKLNLDKDIFKSNFDGSIFYIDTSFNKKGIGFVASGILRGKSINIDDNLLFGPFGKEFFEIKAKSIHNNFKEDIKVIDDHCRGCIALSFKDKKFLSLKKNSFGKGVVLITKNLLNFMCYRFKAAILVFSDKSITIKPGYSPVIHLGTIQQSARVLDNEFYKVIDDNEEKKISKKILGPGSIDTMWFKFLIKPQIIEKGNLFTFRSGHIHGVGLIIDTLPINIDPDPNPDSHKKKFCRYTKNY